MIKGKRVGYIRVSTIDQNPDRQLEGIDLDKKFIDYASGSTTKRVGLESMMEYIREDDIVFVHSMDRMARNVKDLLKIVDTLSSKKVEIQFLKENLTFNGKDSALSKLLLMIIGSVAEFELSLIKERQMEGIAQAKKKGKYRGKPTKLNVMMTEKIIHDLKNTRKTKSQIAKENGISSPSLYRYIKLISKKRGINFDNKNLYKDMNFVKKENVQGEL